MKPVTQADLERRYGYLLDHLARRHLLDQTAPAAAHVTEEALRGFLGEIKAIWRPVTQAQSIYKLRRMAEILSPRTNFAWLRETENDLALVAYPRDRFDRIITTERLLEAGLTLVKEAQLAVHRRRLWRATQLCNGLMIALLALTPIRSKNFASLTLGKSFVRQGDRWCLCLHALETKAGRADERQVDEILNPAIALYLTQSRPVLLGSGEFTIGTTPQSDRDPLSGPLWIGDKGEPLTQGAVELAIALATEMVVGVRMRPHDFRRCAATAAAYHASGMPHLASSLLQHRDRRVTAEHYNRATSIEAGVRFGRLAAALRI
jgi:integrase